jgi:hypothetical protein
MFFRAEMPPPGRTAIQLGTNKSSAAGLQSPSGSPLFTYMLCSFVSGLIAWRYPEMLVIVCLISVPT